MPRKRDGVRYPKPTEHVGGDGAEPSAPTNGLFARWRPGACPFRAWRSGLNSALGRGQLGDRRQEVPRGRWLATPARMLSCRYRRKTRPLPLASVRGSAVRTADYSCTPCTPTIPGGRGARQRLPDALLEDAPSRRGRRSHGVGARARGWQRRGIGGPSMVSPDPGMQLTIGPPCGPLPAASALRGWRLPGSRTPVA
jgi:hypothetical protein